jgi:hypothetical protein
MSVVMPKIAAPVRATAQAAILERVMVLPSQSQRELRFDGIATPQTVMGQFLTHSQCARCGVPEMQQQHE